jgi:hypothetical protein
MKKGTSRMEMRQSVAEEKERKARRGREPHGGIDEGGVEAGWRARPQRVSPANAMAGHGSVFREFEARIDVLDKSFAAALREEARTLR